MFEAYYKSPIGNLRIISNDRDIIKIGFTDDFFKMKMIPYQIQNYITQLNEYFKGEMNVEPILGVETTFTIKLPIIRRKS